jgi:flagellum-specific ATP synthase
MSHPEALPGATAVLTPAPGPASSPPVAAAGRPAAPHGAPFDALPPPNLLTRPAEPPNPWPRYLDDLHGFAAAPVPLATQGRLVRVAGLVLEAAGIRAPVGSLCDVCLPGQPPVSAEVVGFTGDRAYLMPTGEIHGMSSGAMVQPCEIPVSAPVLGVPAHPWRRSEDRSRHLPVGAGLLGRVVDGQGQPLDKLGPLTDVRSEPMVRRPINAMERDPVRQPLDTGVRAINALLTVGRGQRLGLFAGTGVGKSVLMGMMARYTAADVIVVGLIGERGREVKEFIEDILGVEGRARSVVVAAPADAPPLTRLQGAHYATAVAEYFRDQGLDVLLLMDSLTRYAMAQREIALAIGEPPATKGYPPSCFAKLPQLVERSGNGSAGQGSITAFYTVLSEGDDQQDPIADAARGILDGHIVLSRDLAEAGHYPAIDVEKSISRVMPAVAAREHVEAARRIRQMLARLSKARDLIQLGAYTPGHDHELDIAVRSQAQLRSLLQQDTWQRATLVDSIAQLHQVSRGAA